MVWLLLTPQMEAAECLAKGVVVWLLLTPPALGVSFYLIILTRSGAGGKAHRAPMSAQSETSDPPSSSSCLRAME